MTDYRYDLFLNLCIWKIGHLGTKEEYLRYEKFPFLNQYLSDFSYGMVVKIMHEVTEIFS